MQPRFVAIQALIEVAGLPVVETVVALAIIAFLALRIWSIERSHRRIRAVLEKRVAQRTRELEQAFLVTRRVVNAVTESIVVVDANGQATLANPAARELLGVDDRNHDDREVCRIFNRRHPELHDAMREHFGDSADEAPFSVDVEIDGRRRILEISGAPLDGPGSGRVYLIRDITEALNLLTMKNRFVSIVSHEIRTPLTSLAGSLDLLDAGVLGELPTRAADLISVARLSTARLVRLVNDVLDLDRLTSERVSLSPSWQSVDDLLVETVRTMQPLAAEHHVRLVAESSEEKVFADHDRIIQVLLNLVQNAVKFAPPSSMIVVSARRDGDETVFTVDDEGRGIPLDELERVFDAFTQIDTGDDRHDSGTGLGLTICRGIVQRHGGRIWAENRTPVGSRFVFTIPLPNEEMST